MTPLIQKAVRMAPEPETAMWFDVGPMERWDGGRVLVDLVLNLPFPRTGIVGYDRDGKDFALWLTQGTGTVAVGGASMWHGKYMEPFAYIKTDEGLKYYQKEGSFINFVSEEEVRPVFRMVCAILVKLSERKSEAYKPVVKDTFLNRKRKEKGKPAVLFDWHTVEIGPWVGKSESQGGTHASPRLHDRRGHWRTIKATGKKVWVKACKVGDASKGVVFKDYRVTETLQ
jgi:hypothetical protein